MSDKTAISWTDATWNPVTGCSHVSEGCRNCYAEALSQRFGRSTKPWTASNAGENVRLHPERLEQPLRWRQPRRVFVNSMSDLFHEQVSFEFIERVWDVMFDCSGVDGGRAHQFQILTKRPGRMLAFAQWMNTVRLRRVDYPNVWLGVSVENQDAAEERIPRLIQTPAAVRFLSCEPLLGPVEIPHFLEEIDWVIVGGESGAHYRQMDLDWARVIRDDCYAVGVPFFFKQNSGRLPGKGTDALGHEYHEFPALAGVSR